MRRGGKSRYANNMKYPSFGTLMGTSLRVLVLSVITGGCFFGIDRLFMFVMSKVFGM